MWYFTHGRSFTLHPLTKTTLCSCNEWDSPGMYANTSAPLESLTLANFLWAEFGFFGHITDTLRHTPLLNGAGLLLFLLFLSLFIPNNNTGDLDLVFFFFLPCFSNWLIVGICIYRQYNKKIMHEALDLVYVIVERNQGEMVKIMKNNLWLIKNPTINHFCEFWNCRIFCYVSVSCFVVFYKFYCL